MSYQFVKMHGLGNDFVVIDARDNDIDLTPEEVRTMADRRTGIGCDQLLVLRHKNHAPFPPQNDADIDVWMQVFNADGNEANACGNGSRCVAWLLMAKENRQTVTLQVGAKTLKAQMAGDRQVCIEMGAASLDWKTIPLLKSEDTKALPIQMENLSTPMAVNMGNPHMVFFVNDLDQVALERIGPVLEHHRLFPNRANVGVAQIIDPQTLRLKVWERGAGFTVACGTGACAAVVAGHTLGLIDATCTVLQKGGALRIEIAPPLKEAATGEATMTGDVTMTGEVALSFTGSLDPIFLKTQSLKHAS